MRRSFLWMAIEEWKRKQADNQAASDVEAYGLQKIFSDTQIKEVVGVERSLEFVISNASADRDKDTLSVDGWRLESFRKNPVVPFAHDYKSLPVAKAISVSIKNGALVSAAQFVPGDIYPFAETVYRMLQQGFLNAVSVGFRPLKHTLNKERGGFDFLEQELLEYSVVPVPANPEALIVARSQGIDLAPLKSWAEQVLDEVHGESMLCVPKSVIEGVVLSLTPTQVPVTAKCEDEDHEGDQTSVATDAPTATSSDQEVIEVLTDEEELVATEAKLTAEGDADSSKKDVEAVTEKSKDISSETVVKVDPIALSNALPQSFEWVRQQLVEKAPDFLTANGVNYRSDMDIIVPIATFSDKMVFCVLGRDRPFANDPCYQGEYSKDSRLGGIPRFKGEPEQVDVRITSEVIAAVSVRTFEKDCIPESSKQEVEVQEVETFDIDWELLSPEKAVVEEETFDSSIVLEVLKEYDFSSVISREVGESVAKAIKSMRGRID